MRHPLVMGNWKLNGSQQQVDTLVSQLRQSLQGITGCDVAIAPSVPYLQQTYHLIKNSPIMLAAQDVSVNSSGAFTGEVSAAMLHDVGVKYIIIGHSERRIYHSESDQFIAEKFVAIKQQGLIPVLCIGETEQENTAGKTEAVCAKQLDAILTTVGITAFDNSVVAYEPVWAIGTGKSATPEQAQQVHHFIRQHLAQHDATIANRVIIQYGGSVNATNAAMLFSQPDIDGALVGGASLHAEAFITIVKAAIAAKSA